MMVVLLSLWLAFATTPLVNHVSCITEHHSPSTIHHRVVCKEREREALLAFKRGLTDPSSKLASWSVHTDCCHDWIGVVCDNVTGHVIELNLGRKIDEQEVLVLEGDIDAHKLVELESLAHLDLSLNVFTSKIPSLLGSMKSLRHLDLSGSHFQGLVPPELGNLSSLHYLSLRDNENLYVDNLNWITRLHSLEHLDMSYVDLHKAVDWHQRVSQLPSLLELHFPYCQLVGAKDLPGMRANSSSLEVLNLSGNAKYLSSKFSFPVNWLSNLNSSLRGLYFSTNSLDGQIPESISSFDNLVNLSLSNNHLSENIPGFVWQLKHLQILDLSGNSLSGGISEAVGNLSSLRELSLSSNQLKGNIPEFVGQLKHLQILHLSGNSLSGGIPEAVGNLSLLRQLSLFSNQLKGTLPKSFRLLSNLEVLFLHHNSLGGNIFEADFSQLSELRYLDISSTSLSFNTVNPDWVPPFQLKSALLSNCNIGPKFPRWLKTQTSLVDLDLSESGISDTAPGWFWKLVSGIKYLNLRRNQINGCLSNVLLNSTIVDLSSNHFEGQLPHLSLNVQTLVLANNSFSGPISPLLCQIDEKIKHNLRVLDLSNNHLSGELLDDCWMPWQSLDCPNLGRNNLPCKLPSSMASLVALEFLYLEHNNFSGGIPSSLQNCRSLQVIDLGENNLIGDIPSWLGEITTLYILRLKSNNLSGNIPVQICQLHFILVLDLSNNGLTGTIPRCFDTFWSMVTTNIDNDYNYYNINEDKPHVQLVIKNLELEYKKIAGLRVIDLSSNDLSGSIPPKICSLRGLRFLNLSRNQLVGKIPDEIGNMKSLESLDLSRNHLSGEIPQGITSLTSIACLNLSYNNLFGKIPSSTQILGFNESCFTANDGLCGLPLPKKCGGDEETPSQTVPSEEDSEEADDFFCFSCFYSGMGIGYAISFWGVCGALFFKREWRHAYFGFLGDVKDLVYVCIVLTINRFNRKFKRSSVAIVH